MKHESFNESTEMYLKTISELADRDQGPVPISALAERMGVSNVSATEMVHRLDKQGFLEHTPYKGVSLTPHGRRRATEIIRSHHMWECFLAEQLGLPWEQVHDYACRLEHATDTTVTEALYERLGRPQRCPHGNPIPDAHGVTARTDDRSLAGMMPGQQGIISRISPESTLLLDYLAARNLRPGRPLLYEERAPFNGPLIVVCGSERHALGEEIAAHIFVTLEE